MKAFEVICYLLAMLGIILTWIGRRLIINEAVSIGQGWAWAVRLLPLADIMFLARFWDSAKGGAFLSIAGLVCLLPLGGKVLSDQQHAAKIDYAAEGRRLSLEEKSRLFTAVQEEHQARIKARQHKLEQLNTHMAAWYQAMTERRAKLTPADLAAFNEEAAAYQSLRDVTRRESEELQTMLGRRLNTIADLSDEDYGRQARGGSRHRLTAALATQDLAQPFRHPENSGFGE